MKLQTTVTGHTAWAIAKLASRKGKTHAEIASTLLDAYFDENPKFLKEHGITFEAFEVQVEGKGGEVVPIERLKDK